MKLVFKKTSIPKNFSDSNADQWMDWSWQLRKSFKTCEDFKAHGIPLTANELEAFEGGREIFNIRATPYYASLMNGLPDDPIRKILMPQSQELAIGIQQMEDPLAEKKNNPVPRIIHRYPDRLLFLVTDICSVYCRYCTRKHFTGQDQAFIKEQEYEKALQYIASQKGLREVILSGGDPLTLSDHHLERVLHDLRQIDHVEIIRVGTRMPVVCPMRVTEKLAKIFRKYKPVYLMVHFNHPREVTAEAKEALELLVDHGIPVFNQMVLLNGVNNHPAIVQALSRRLLYCRVKPYYMFQCDPSNGTDHLRISLEESLNIQKELWGTLSGLAMPNLSLDIPGGGGKVGFAPQFEIHREPGKYTYQGWDGVVGEYLEPLSQNITTPSDAADYMDEWMQTKSAKQKDFTI